MKIIKAPMFREVTCFMCGTVFLPEVGDDFECVFNYGINKNIISAIYTHCPVCEKRVKIYDEEYGYEL